MPTTPATTSFMRQTMDHQAEALAQLVEDEAPVAEVADRLRGRRVLAIGIGTSWHAAAQAAALTASATHPSERLLSHAINK